MADWPTRSAVVLPCGKVERHAIDRVEHACPDQGETAAGATLRVEPDVGVHEVAGNLLVVLGGSVVLDAA